MASPGFITAADTTNMQAGGTTVFEDVGNVFTKGVGAAVVSGWHGLLNTGIDAVNYFGADIERADTVKTLNQIDNSWGDYYQQNKGAIDVAGFIGASLVPGGLAVKGLKMVQAGGTAGAFSRVLGYAANKEAIYLNKALSELAVEGGTVFTRINGAKVASMAWGTADAALQVAAFETAAAITMKSSPLLENESWKHIGWDVITSSVFGGALGGGINALLTNRLVKQVGTQVESKQRFADRVAGVGNLNISVGDKAYSIVDAVMALPKEMLDTKITLKHSNTLAL